MLHPAEVLSYGSWNGRSSALGSSWAPRAPARALGGLGSAGVGRIEALLKSLVVPGPAGDLHFHTVDTDFRREPFSQAGLKSPSGNAQATKRTSRLPRPQACS